MGAATALATPPRLVPDWCADWTLVFEENVRDVPDSVAPSGHLSLDTNVNIPAMASSGYLFGTGPIQIDFVHDSGGNDVFALHGTPNELSWDVWEWYNYSGPFWAWRRNSEGLVTAAMTAGLGWRRHVIRYARWIESDAGYNPWGYLADFDPTRTNWRVACDWTIDGVSVFSVDWTRAEFAAAVVVVTGTGHADWACTPGHAFADFASTNTKLVLNFDDEAYSLVPLPYPRGTCDFTANMAGRPTSSSSSGWDDGAAAADGLDIAIRNVQLIRNGVVLYGDDHRDGHPEPYTYATSSLSLRQGAQVACREETDGLRLQPMQVSDFFGGAGPPYSRLYSWGHTATMRYQADEWVSRYPRRHAGSWCGLERRLDHRCAIRWDPWYPRWQPWNSGSNPSGVAGYVTPTEADWYTYAKLRDGVDQYTDADPPEGYYQAGRPEIAYRGRYDGNPTAMPGMPENGREVNLSDDAELQQGQQSIDSLAGSAGESGGWWQCHFDNIGPGDCTTGWHQHPTVAYQPWGLDWYADARTAQTMRSIDAVAVVDGVGETGCIVGLVDEWDDPPDSRAAYSLRLCRADPPDAPYVIATLATDDDWRGYRLADAAMTADGVLWVALYKLKTDGTHNLIFYRQESRWHEAELVHTVTDARRPVRWAARFAADRVSGELWFVYQQCAAGNSPDLMAWVIPTLHETAPTYVQLDAPLSAIPTPPYGDWCEPSHANYGTALIDFSIGMDGLPLARCAWGWFLDPAETVDSGWSATHYGDRAADTTEIAEGAVPYVEGWRELRADRALIPAVSPAWSQVTPAEWVAR